MKSQGRSLKIDETPKNDSIPSVTRSIFLSNKESASVADTDDKEVLPYLFFTALFISSIRLYKTVFTFLFTYKGHKNILLLVIF